MPLCFAQPRVVSTQCSEHECRAPNKCILINNCTWSPLLLLLPLTFAHLNCQLKINWPQHFAGDCVCVLVASVLRLRRYRLRLSLHTSPQTTQPFLPSFKFQLFRASCVIQFSFLQYFPLSASVWSVIVATTSKSVNETLELCLNLKSLQRRFVSELHKTLSIRFHTETVSKPSNAWVCVCPRRFVWHISFQLKVFECSNTAVHGLGHV